MKLRAPAIPLITVDPFFSVWSPDEKINVAKTMHWTGKNNSLLGIVTVDGVDYSFLGYDRNLYKMRQISLDIDALSTKAVFENGKIRLPFSSLGGLGEGAAQKIVEARADGEFFSIEELRERAKLTKSVIEILSRNGVLDNLSETNQYTLF